MRRGWFFAGNVWCYALGATINHLLDGGERYQAQYGHWVALGTAVLVTKVVFFYYLGKDARARH